MPNEVKLGQRTYPSLPSSGWGYVLAGCIFAILFSRFTPTFANVPKWVIRSADIIYIAALCYFFYIIHRIHNVLHDITNDSYPITPTKAVGFHFVPLFNIYWLFSWTNRLSEFINSTSPDVKMRKWWIGCSLLIAFLLVVAYVPVGVMAVYAPIEVMVVHVPIGIMAIYAPIGVAALFGVIQYITTQLKRTLSGGQTKISVPVSPSQLVLSAGLGSGFALLAILAMNDLFFRKQQDLLLQNQQGYGLYELVATFAASAGVLVFIDPLTNQLKEKFNETEEDNLTQHLQPWRWQVVGFITIASVSHTAIHMIAADMIEHRKLKEAVIIAFGTIVPAAITRAWISQIQQGRSAAWAGGCVGVMFAVLVVLVKSAIKVPATSELHQVIMAVGSACQYGACGFFGGLALDRRWGSTAIRGIEFAFLGVTAVVVLIVVLLDHFVANTHRERIEILLYFARVVGWSYGFLALKPAAEALLRPQRTAGS